MPILFGEVIVPDLNIRPSAGTAQASLGKLKQYDLIEASEEVNGWWKLTSIKRGGQQIPLPASVCWAYEGLKNGYIRNLSMPAPDPTVTLKHTINVYSDGSIQVDNGAIVP